MPTEHVNIPDGERHEPKGADSATSGQVYVSDGANSGSWSKPSAANTTIADAGGYLTATEVEAAIQEIMAEMPGGWGLYVDNAAAQNITTTATKLQINGSGTGDTGHLPLAIRGSDHLWDTATDDIKPVAQDDILLINLTLPITAVTTAAKLQIEVDVSSGSTPTTIIYDNTIVPTVDTYEVSFPLRVTSDFVTNKAQIFLTCDAGNIDVTAPSILITRIHSGSM